MPQDNHLEFFVLVHLARCHGRERQVRTAFQAAKALKVNPASVIPVLAALRARGLVVDDGGVNELPPKSGRKRRPVRLSAKGIEDFRRRASEWLSWHQSMGQAVSEGLVAVGKA